MCCNPTQLLVKRGKQHYRAERDWRFGFLCGFTSTSNIIWTIVNIEIIACVCFPQVDCSWCFLQRQNILRFLKIHLEACWRTSEYPSVLPHSVLFLGNPHMPHLAQRFPPTAPADGSFMSTHYDSTTNETGIGSSSSRFLPLLLLHPSLLTSFRL